MRKLFSALVVLLPFLCQFGLPVNIPVLTSHLPIGYLVVLPFALFWCFSKIPTEGIFKVKVYPFCGYFLFLLLTVFSTIFAKFKGIGTRSSVADILVFAGFWLVVLYAAKGVFNLRFAMNFYSSFAILSALYFILQFLVFRFKGVYIPTIFKASYVFGREYVDTFRLTGIPTSLFLTVSSFILFCLPAIAYLLLWDRTGFKGKQFIGAVILSGAIVLTKNDLAIVSLGIVWGIYVLSIFVYFILHPYDGMYRFLHQSPVRIVIQILFPCLVGGVGFLFLANGKLTRFLSRFKAMLADPDLTSGFTKVSEIGNKGAFFRLFGCGAGNGTAFLEKCGIALPESINSLGNVFLCLGLVGLIVYIGSMFGLLSTRNGKFGFSIAFLLIVFSVFGNLVFSVTTPLWFVLAFAANDNNEMTFKKFYRIR